MPAVQNAQHFVHELHISWLNCLVAGSMETRLTCSRRNPCSKWPELALISGTIATLVRAVSRFGVKYELAHPSKRSSTAEVTMGKRRNLWMRFASLVLAIAPAPLAAQSMMRPDVMGREAAVVSDHVLASMAGAAVLRNGGNAVDAA